MAKRYRLTGLQADAVDQEKHEIHFELSVGHDTPISFIARYGPLSQAVGALGRILTPRRALSLLPLKMLPPGISSATAGKSIVLLQITTPQGVPYNLCFVAQRC